MKQPTELYNGLRLVETTAIKKQVQRKTHRKRRINKKWLKRYGYKTVPDNKKIVIWGDCCFSTSKIIEKIIEQMKGGSEEC